MAKFTTKRRPFTPIRRTIIEADWYWTKSVKSEAPTEVRRSPSPIEISLWLQALRRIVAAFNRGDSPTDTMSWKLPKALTSEYSGRRLAAAARRITQSKFYWGRPLKWARIPSSNPGAAEFCADGGLVRQLTSPTERLDESVRDTEFAPVHKRNIGEIARLPSYTAVRMFMWRLMYVRRKVRFERIGPDQLRQRFGIDDDVSTGDVIRALNRAVRVLNKNQSLRIHVQHLRGKARGRPLECTEIALSTRVEMPKGSWRRLFLGERRSPELQAYIKKWLALPLDRRKGLRARERLRRQVAAELGLAGGWALPREVDDRVDWIIWKAASEEEARADADAEAMAETQRWEAYTAYLQDLDSDLGPLRPEDYGIAASWDWRTEDLPRLKTRHRKPVPGKRVRGRAPGTKRRV